MRSLTLSLPQAPEGLISAWERLLRLFVFAVFGAAAVGKLFDISGFERSIASAAPWLPLSLLLGVALVLIVVELLIAASMLSKRWLRLGAVVGVGLAGVFTVFTGFKLLTGLSEPCDCFGVFLSLPPTAVIFIDVALFTACAMLSKSTQTKLSSTQGVEAIKAGSILLPLLICGLMVSWIVFWHVLPNEPVLYRNLGAVMQKLHPAHFETDPITADMRRNDPHISRLMAVPTVAGLKPGKPIIIAIMSNCTRCSLGGLNGAEYVTRKYGLIEIYVSSDSSGTMAHILGQMGSLAHPVSDPTGKWRMDYNATWQPRCYLLNANRRLVWKQDGIRLNADELEKSVQEAL